MKLRLDKLLAERGLFKSGEKASRAVMAGMVTVDGIIATKPGRKVDAGCDIAIKERERFVGRGGEKLESALEAFKVSVKGKKCLDIGTSTGGFADCLLQAGATEVICVDVGHGQIDQRLREDARVILMERTNARYLSRSDLPFSPEIVTIDVSFISLGKIIPAVVRMLEPGAMILALVKPQFEAERKDIKRGGVVKDSRVHTQVLWKVCSMCEEHGLVINGMTDSPIKGPAGNKEFFILAVR